MARIVIALGGNALGDTPREQRERIDRAAPSLVGLIKQGHEIVVSHGNGPQVGLIKSAMDAAGEAEYPLPECTALSQGYIGFHLQNGILRELRRENMPWHVATVITQVEVSPEDPSFGNPTKPIGAFYSEAEARAVMSAEEGAVFREDAGRGWRRCVPSPRPIDIVEKESILNLLDHEFVVIACGGGGIPVVRMGDGDYRGADAVIDKDFASEKLAEAVGADCLFILTAVDRVSVNYGRPDQRELDRLTVAEALKLAEQGHFAAGSMLPKVRAAAEFAASSPGRRAVIASLEKAPLAMRGESGTTITG